MPTAKPTLNLDEKEAAGKENPEEDLADKDMDDISVQVKKEHEAERVLNEKKLRGLSRSVEAEYKHLRSHERSWIIDCVDKEDQEPFLKMLEKIPNPPVKPADKKANQEFYIAMRAYTDRIQPEEHEKFALRMRFEGVPQIGSIPPQKGLMDEVKEVIRKLKRTEATLKYT
jgi:hypothetical protein